MKTKKNTPLYVMATTALLAAAGALSASFIIGGVRDVHAEGENNVISASSESDWFHNVKTEGQGTWAVSGSAVTVDAFGGNYALEGANYLTHAGTALGAYSFTTKITVSELNHVQNPMVGIIPWYVDEDNYLYVQLKFTWDADQLTTPEEKADGYAIEQLIFSGKYNGESKYITATSQQENTVFPTSTVAALKNNKVAPKNAGGHTLKVTFENSSATATSYKVGISYNGVEIGSTYAYYYNAIAKNKAVGFMAQDVKATFSEAVIDDYYATNTTAALARDWKENNGFTYRVLNGKDVWNFNSDDSISFVTDPIKEGNKVVSQYRVSGSNIAGYDTNRGFMENQYKQNEEGLPQNYEVSASFKLDEVPSYSGSKTVQGYGLMPWYKDDQNFVDVTFRRTVSGLAAAPDIKYEVVLFGWIECSSATIGENIYELPENFDPTVNHTLTVQKKSNSFLVYLDGGDTPILRKTVKGTNINYYYGYEGYNAKFTGSKINSKAIYSAYDEIAVLDDQGNEWRVSGKSQDAWSFAGGTTKIQAKESSDTITARSYLLGGSDISDRNMTVEAKVDLSFGSASYSEFVLSPYVVDENNYARIGLTWQNGTCYAVVRASTYTEEDMDEDRDPTITVRRFALSGIDVSKTLEIKAEKIDTTLALYVNGTLVYGIQIKDIDQKSEDYGVYVYDVDATIHSLETIGYKRYDPAQVGEWQTSGMKYNEWTIDEDGHMHGDGTYTKDMTKEDKDAEKNFAIKPNAYDTNYEMTVRIRATDQSEAEDRVGVVMWYLDEDNFMIFYMDRWRADSTVPRTTIYGRIEGETLPTTYNHGGWLAEGDQIVEGGMTQTEASQVTNWHTIKVIKQKNTFTCYIDNNSNGYISYTVAAGLPSTEGKTLYSGLYTFNDAIEVSAYDVTEVGASVPGTLPCPAGNPYNAHIDAPSLPVYADEATVDVIDGTKGNDDDGGSSSSQEIPSSEDPVTSEGEGGSGGGCGGAIASGVAATIIGLGAATALALKRRKMKK